MRTVSIFAAVFTLSTYSLSAKTTWGYSGLDAATQNAFNTYASDQKTTTESGKLSSSYASYAAGMPDAALASTFGLGVSYGPGPKVAIFGVNFGMGIVENTGSFSDFFQKGPASVEGIGANLSIMAGLNLGIFSVPFLSKMKVYTNFMTMTLPLSSVGNVDFVNFGIHLQYSLIDDVPLVPAMITWGGLRVTTGYRLTSNNVSFQNASLGNYQVTSGLTWQPKGTISSKSFVSSIPVELSTSINLIFLTLFGGFGLDLNFGSTDFTVSAKGGFKETTGTAWLKTTQSIAPTPIDYRLFGGLQVNIFMLKLVGQFNYVPTSGSYGLLAGTRVAF